MNKKQKKIFEKLPYMSIYAPTPGCLKRLSCNLKSNRAVPASYLKCNRKKLLLSNALADSLYLKLLILSIWSCYTAQCTTYVLKLNKVIANSIS